VLDKDTGSGLAIAAVCAVALTTLLGRFLRAVVGHRHAFRAASQAARACSAVRGQLLVLPQDAPDVYALGGRPAVIVATRGLLRSLPAIERRAVLVHEHAHIARRHHRHLAAATLSAALNPLLLRVPAASAFAVERWADELAASSTSRAATRSALTRLAGLVPAASKAPSPAALAAAATTSIAGRVAALRQAPPPLSPMRLIFPAGLAVGSILAAAVLTGHIVDLLAATAAATGKVLPHH
jgi:Zn-dependent protease with chaperone function